MELNLKLGKENIIYETKTTKNPDSEQTSTTSTQNLNLIDEVIDEINISPFNNNKWSKNSSRKSKYRKTINPKFRVKIVDGKIQDPRDIQFDNSSCLAVPDIPSSSSFSKSGSGSGSGSG